MLIPFAVGLIVTVLPFAFIPKWVHPAFTTPQTKRVYNAFVWSVLLFAWLAMTVTNMWWPMVAFFIWLGTIAFFATAAYKSIRARIRLTKLNRQADTNAGFTAIDREFAAMPKGHQ